LGSNSRIPLILPVEIQVRELDAKILFACVAAQRGFPVVIGKLKTLLARIASLPRSVFISKGMGAQSVEKFKFIRGLGHEICGWDEEALVHYPAETHFGKRVAPDAGQYISQLFAWGPESAELWRSSPQFRESPIHVTGNPRLDLLRREIRPYFESEARDLRDANGDFILVNTNFPLVNSNRGIFLNDGTDGAERSLGIGGRGMTRTFAEGLHRHKQANFIRFQQMIPDLARAFPEVTVIVRPHPSEKPEVYNAIAGRLDNVVIENSGNVIPWSIASRATIHNGCTTGVEANLLDVPTLCYGPSREDDFDLGQAFHLPNLISHQCPDFESLRQRVRQILAGEIGCAEGADRDRLLAEFVAPMNGPLACERILDVIEEFTRGSAELPKPPLPQQLDAWRRIAGMRLEKVTSKISFQRSAARASATPTARRAVYPEVSLEEMQRRVSRFQDILGFADRLAVEPHGRHLYRIRL
jgi:surface carbohydrate biosynthesis protein